MTTTVKLALWLLLVGALACERKERAPEPPPAEPKAESVPSEACCKKPETGLTGLVERAAQRGEVLRALPNSADPSAPAIGFALVGEGPTLVTDVEFIPGKPRWLVITGQAGEARLLELPETPGQLAAQRGLLLRVAVDSQSEMGLLSIAFHPHYEENGRLFVHYNPEGKQATRLAEFVLPMAELGTSPAVEQKVLLELKQPFRNHNGGELAFGPDGKLYLGLGDGGSGNDPYGNGQKLSTLLGKILRLDVDREPLAPPDNPFVNAPNARPEIFAYGLRNPWKISFDPKGRLIAADVGQNRFEEIDLVQAGDNLGWNPREAAHCFAPKSGCKRDGLIDPVFEYARALGQSVTGGYVYTGKSVPELARRYLLSDFVTRRFWALELPEDARAQARSTVLGVFELGSAAFGRDHDGELYVSDYGSGRLFKLVGP